MCLGHAFGIGKPPSGGEKESDDIDIAAAVCMMGAEHAAAVVRVDTRPRGALPEAVIWELDGREDHDEDEPASEFAVGLERAGDHAIIEKDERLERYNGGPEGGEGVAFAVEVPAQSGDDGKCERVQKLVLAGAALDPVHDNHSNERDKEEFVEEARQRQRKKPEQAIARQEPPEEHQAVEQELGAVEQENAEREHDNDGGPAQWRGDAKHAEEEIHCDQPQQVGSDGDPVDESVDGELVLRALAGTDQRTERGGILMGGGWHDEKEQ